MKLKDYIFLLLSYTNASDIKTKYPNIKSIAIINIVYVILYFIIPTFMAKAILTLAVIVINFCFKEIRGIAITFTPIIIWVLLFSTAKDIPMDWRRPIDVESLVNLEKKFGSVSFKFYNKNENILLDLLAWLPYGIVHYVTPFLVGIYLIIFYKPGYTFAYLFFFGIMNAAGVLTQLAWPTSPPWYYKKYGTNPANYGMHGDPAGLKKIDEIFHVDLYYTTFTGNPLPWGAWPSLHSAFAVYSATFLTYLYPKYFLLYYFYVGWIWWATMYLGHHYFVDLLGGFVYAIVCVFFSIIYLMITKPHHKDYAELKSIMIQDNSIELTTNIQSIHKNNNRGYNVISLNGINSIDSDQKNLEGSTIINGSIIVKGDENDGEKEEDKEDASLSFKGFLTPKKANKNYQALPKDQMSVLSNVDRDEDENENEVPSNNLPPSSSSSSTIM